MSLHRSRDMKPAKMDLSQTTETPTLTINKDLRSYGLRTSKNLSLRPTRSVKNIKSVRPKAAKVADKA